MGFLMAPEEFQEGIFFTNLEARAQFKLSMTGLQKCFPSNNFCGHENEINRILTNYINNFENSKKFFVIEMNQAVNNDGFTDVYFDVFHPRKSNENPFANMVQLASSNIFQSLGANGKILLIAKFALKCQFKNVSCYAFVLHLMNGIQSKKTIKKAAVYHNQLIMKVMTVVKTN